MPEGYYVLTTFQASGAQNKEIQRNLEINDMILRYLIIKLLDKKQSVKPKPIRPAAVPVKEAPVKVAANEEKSWQKSRRRNLLKRPTTFPMKKQLQKRPNRR